MRTIDLLTEADVKEIVTQHLRPFYSEFENLSTSVQDIKAQLSKFDKRLAATAQLHEHKQAQINEMIPQIHRINERLKAFRGGGGGNIIGVKRNISKRRKKSKRRNN